MARKKSLAYHAPTEQEARSARQKEAWRRKKSAAVQKQTDELEKTDKINQLPDADAADHGGYGAIALTDLIGDIGLGPTCDVTEWIVANVKTPAEMNELRRRLTTYSDLEEIMMIVGTDEINALIEAL